MLVPKLRFPDYSGDWKKSTIGESGEFYYGRSCPKWSVTNDATIPCIRYGELYTKFENKIDKVYSYTSIEPANLRFSKGTEVLVPRVGEDPMDYTHCAWLSLPNVAIGEMISVYNTDNNPLFTALMFNAKLRTEFAKRVEGGSVTNLYYEKLRNIVIYYPTDLEEQQKIADFLSTVDEVIAQSEAEVQNLEQQKKAAMQKIFSQEVRFKREDGTEYPEWGNKSFANAFAPLNNNTFSRDMLSENGTVLNIHYGDILVKFGEVCDIQAMDIPKVNAEIDTSKYDELQDGDIILADTAEDETVGKAIEIYHTGTSKVVSGLHTMACRPNDKYASKYMGYYINSPTYHNQLLPYMQGIKVTSIGRKNIADTVIYYPADLEEQQKIADFLSAYDEAIRYAKQELDKWKELKKGLLQQMFV